MAVVSARSFTGGSVYARGGSFAPRNCNTSPSVVRRRVCRYWASGNCKWGKDCRFLHRWADGHGFSMLTQLSGHKKSVTGIALCSGKLYTGSTDGTVRIWNCDTGVCERFINNGSEVGCLVSEGPWVFVGLLNRIRAWNTETGAEVDVKTPNLGQIYSIAIDGDTLFAGGHGGSITAFKAEPVANTLSFKVVGSLKGHSGPVTCLKTGAGKRLFSGSRDSTVRVWDTESMSCVGVLKGHTQTVTSLLCFEQFLISGSLDGSIKIWSSCMEEVYSREEEAGVRVLNGVSDAEGKPVLLSSCDDDTVYIYELPSFAKKGRVFSKKSVGSIQTGPSGMLFTGDLSGSVTVWNMQDSTSC